MGPLTVDDREYYILRMKPPMPTDVRIRRASLALCAAALLAGPATAQRGTQPAPIPIRQLTPPIATSVEALANVQHLMQFRNGNVLVNDQRESRLLLLDSTLTRVTVAADTKGTGAAAYTASPLRPSLFTYLGDSAAFVDAAAGAFIIIGPDGRYGRAMAHPRPQDFGVLSQGGAGVPGFDAKGRFVYRSVVFRVSGDTSRRTLDSAALIRADFETRKRDTVAVVALPYRPPLEIYKNEQGKAAADLVINPIPPGADEWIVTSDGSIAIIRAVDYHIDWVRTDGSTASSPKMPFDWRRLTDRDKLARIDSMRRIIDSVNATGTPYGRIFSYCSPGPRGERPEVRGPRCLAERQFGRVDTIVPSVSFLPLAEIPDYVAPIRPFTIKADRNNHVWILPTTTLNATGGGLLYDVVNTRGEIVERVQLPAGRTLGGFGPNGEVYLLALNGAGRFTLEKRLVRRA
jgi:hypothetical protein